MASRTRDGFWQRLFGGRGRPRIAAAPPEVPEPVVLQPPEDAWLAQLAVDVVAGRRIEAIGNSEFMSQLASLSAGGRERGAIEWAVKFLTVAAIPSTIRQQLRMYVGEQHTRRGELAEAEPHFTQLLLDARPDAPEAARANALLGDYHRGRGDVAAALRHYEAVLAFDVDYPNVRARVARLRADAGRGEVSAGATLASADLSGVSAGARYRLMRELGRGATGVVYVARDLELERDVAIKLLHPHLAAANSADALHHFFREARVMASLRHPNVVAVLDLDEKSRRIVMELAAGGTLRDVLVAGPRTLRRTLEHLLQILAALAAAHPRGIIHRDLKPGNLMFRRDADLPGVEVMLGDFGIAHLPDVHAVDEPAGSGVRSRAQNAVGTLPYMAPEQRRGEPATTAVDLYAVAVVTFEMLTARLPWTRDVMLRGTRTRADFELPTELLAAMPGPVATGLQTLLTQLGDPSPHARPTTQDALAAAMALRDQAIAAGALSS